MKSIILAIGGVEFHLYGLFVLLGILFSALVVSQLLKQKKLKIKHYFDAILLISLVGLISARVIYLLFYWENYSKILDFLYFWQSGLSVYGGILGGSIFAYYYLKRNHENMWRWLDIIIIGFYPGWAFVSLGNYICVNFLASSGDGQQMIVPLLETIWALFFFVLIIILWQNLVYLEGRIYFFGIGIFSFARLIFGFSEKREMILGILSFEQIFSLLIITICFGLILEWHRFIKPNLKTRIIAKILRI